MKYLVEIRMRAVVDESDVVTDRLRYTDEESPGCPLNILPRLALEAKDHGDAMNVCPFCGGRADAWIVREATPDDVARFTWNALPDTESGTSGKSGADTRT